MKTRERIRVILSIILLAGLGVATAGCNKEPPEGLYDPNYASTARPAVTSVTPASSGLAGVTVITLAGKNFSPAMDQNLVFFDATPGTILSATATQLIVRAPVLVKDTIQIRVAVRGSSYFSDPPVSYGLAPACATFGELKSTEEPFGIACDRSGNVYVSILDKGLGIGVKKFTPSGLRSDYSTAFSSQVNKWVGMKFGRGDTLFAVAGRNVIFRILPGGGAPAVWKSAIATGGLSDLDFDANGNIWTGGENTAFYSVRTTDKVWKAFPFRGNVRSLRVYNNYLYLGGKRDSLEKVWRYWIVSSDSVGPEEEYFSLSSVYGANAGGVYAITFNSAGDLYVGTDGADGIRLVHPGGASEQMYPPLIAPQPIAFAWGSGSTLYFSRGGLSTHVMIWVNTEKTSAPYYGQGLL